MIAFPSGVQGSGASAGPPGRPVGQETFAEYIAAGGYLALKSAVLSDPGDLITLIQAAGLRGRGGAGFPAGDKWRIAAETPATARYIVCNAGEDEPGSFKDRLLIETRPHLIVEGAILAAYAVGASHIYLYVNRTYDECHRRLDEAIAEAATSGYIGDRILGAPFSVEVSLHKAPTVYVAGEDTASIEFLEGREPKPREKPPYPAVSGLFGKPTVVNNVETLAHVAPIVRNGAEWYREFGTERAPGTMIFCLGDEVVSPGAYELPVGVTTRFLLEECGGGMKDDKPVKAFLPGGPSCAFLSGADLDVGLEPEALAGAGSSLGCGVMRFYPEGTCMVEPVIELAGFFAEECCGQCPACKMETSMLTVALGRIQSGEGDSSLFDQIPKVLEFNRGKGFCALVNMPGPPLMSAIRLFRSDFDHHLSHGTCSGSATT